MTTLDDLFDLLDLAEAVESGFVRTQRHPSLPLTIYNYSEKAQYDVQRRSGLTGTPRAAGSPRRGLNPHSTYTPGGEDVTGSDQNEQMDILRELVEKDVEHLMADVDEPIQLSAGGYGQYLAYQAVLSYMTGIRRTPPDQS